MAELAVIIDWLQDATWGDVAGSPQPLDGGITNRNYRVSFGEG